MYVGSTYVRAILPLPQIVIPSQLQHICVCVSFSTRSSMSVAALRSVIFHRMYVTVTIYCCCCCCVLSNFLKVVFISLSLLQSLSNLGRKVSFHWNFFCNSRIATFSISKLSRGKEHKFSFGIKTYVRTYPVEIHKTDLCLSISLSTLHYGIVFFFLLISKGRKIISSSSSALIGNVRTSTTIACQVSET